MRKNAPAGVGFRTHTGWAVAVVLAGGGPQVVARIRLTLIDASLPREVYHAAGRRDAAQAEELVSHVAASAHELSDRALKDIMTAAQASGYALVGAGITVTGNGSRGDAGRSLASHAGMHSAEGWLYRNALRDACRTAGLPALALQERDVYGQAAAAVGRPTGAVRECIDGLGRLLGPPWGQDQKMAAAAAWAALCSYANDSA